jgi:hypothetical protein
VESIGNLYDYPRESIERRKLVRQLRRIGLQSGFEIPDVADDELAAKRQNELYSSLLDLESELARCEEKPRMAGA